jgi:hypothetical protein
MSDVPAESTIIEGRVVHKKSNALQITFKDGTGATSTAVRRVEGDVLPGACVDIAIGLRPYIAEMN